jgi:hypothetical protein
MLVRNAPGRVLLTTVAALVALGTAPAAIAGARDRGPRLTTTIDGKTRMPVRTRWLARPPGKASAVKEVRFLIDGKLRWVEHDAPFNYGSDDGQGHLGSLVTSWLSPGRHRFTTQALLARGRTLSSSVVARVIKAPAPPAALAGRWRRTFTNDDLTNLDPVLPAFVPAGTWDQVFDRVGVWDLDPLGTGIAHYARILGDTIHIDAPLWTTLERYGHKDIGGSFCREDGPVGTYRWSVSNGQLTLTPLSEPCLPRRAVWAGIWTRVS